MVDQLGQLRLWKRRRVERQGVAPSVLKVTLHPHGTEQEETERDGGRAFQTIGDRPGATRRGHDSPGRAPSELGRRAAGVASGEAHTLVGRVGPEVHDPASTAIQVDLEGVSARVLIDARLVALVRGGVVEPRLGKLEHGGGREASATLQQIEEGKEAHGGWIVPFFTSLDKSALCLDKSAFGGHFTCISHRLEGSRYATGPSWDPRARRWPVVGAPT